MRQLRSIIASKRSSRIGIAMLMALCYTSCKEPKKEAILVKEVSSLNCDTNLPDNFMFPQLAEYYENDSSDDRQIATYVRRIFEDSKGNLWFGTNGLGIARYNGQQLDYFSVGQGMGGNQVTGIIEDKDKNIWISNSGGVSVYDGNTFKTYTERDGLANNWVWNVFQDSRGTIWAGTLDGLCKFNGNGFEEFELPVAHVDNVSSRFSSKLVRSIMEDSKGNLWFGTDGVGVVIYNGTDFKHLTKKDGLCGNQVVCILEDRNGDIWMSSMFGGASKYDGSTFTNFSTDNHLGNNEVWNLYEDRAGNIWFTSEGFGVYRYNGKAFKNYSTNEGLQVKAVQTMFEDSKGTFWVGGGGGLYNFDGLRFHHISRGAIIGC